MHGWQLWDIDHDTTCAASNTCSFAALVIGPDSAPAGTGSAFLEAGANSSPKMALVTKDLGGTRLDQITSLAYSSYRDSGGPYAVPIVFEVDYDLTDTLSRAQGLMVYLPTNDDTTTSPQGSWVSWNALTASKWGGSAGYIVPAAGLSVRNRCAIAPAEFTEGPCTWAQLKSKYPNIGVAVGGRFGFYVADVWDGFPGMGRFRGNIDKLELAIGGASSTYDFELTNPAGTVSALAPDSVPSFSAADVIGGGVVTNDSIIRGIVIVEFLTGTAQAARQAAIDAVQGTVIGGRPVIDDDGFYYVRVPDDGTAESVRTALEVLDSLPQVDVVAPIDIEMRKWSSSLVPRDGDPDFQHWNLNPNEGVGKNWGLERIRAPLAWGCTTGSPSTLVGVIDVGVDTIVRDGTAVIRDLADNTASLNAFRFGTQQSGYTHGRWVTSTLAARGNNGVGMNNVESWTDHGRSGGRPASS